MAKKKSYFAKSVIIADNGERIEPGEEVKGLKKDQADRLLELDAITEDEIEGEEDNKSEGEKK